MRCSFLFLLVALLVIHVTFASIDVGNVETAGVKADLSADVPPPSAEKFQFQAEVNRLMDIIINSLYSNRDVFLRELISNASDALDKLRFMALSDPKLLKEDSKLEIRIRANKEDNTLEISDTGIGMTRDHLIKNLGTIAKSGTSAFLKKAKNAKDTSNLIGQFGVGFYSAYLVADRVQVTSKSDDDKQHVWESGAEQTFSIYEDESASMERGTILKLHMKDDASEYLDEEKLKELVKKYSQFIQFPIYVETTEEVDVEIKDDEGASTDDSEKSEEAADDEKVKDNETDDEEKTEDESDDDDIKVEDGDAKKDDKPKTRKEKRKSWTLVNENKPIWTRDPNDITEEQYTQFYDAIAKTPGKSIAKTHFKGEGDVEFRSILYVPDRPPVGLYSGNVEEEKDAIRLYVRRVLVTDKFEYALLPRYLGFLIGIVDSDDIPINVSREMLQQSKTMDIIKRKLIRKALEMFRGLMKEDEKAAEEDDEEKKEDKVETEKEDADTEKKDDMKKKSKYIDFWTKYGKSIKLGVVEDRANQARLAKLLRFRTSKTNTEDPYDWASFDQYMERMKDDQDMIYYLSGADLASVKESPFLEKLIKKGYEVIYLTEPIDEHMIMQLPDYDGTKFMSIAKDNFKFGEKDQAEEKEKGKFLRKKFKPLTAFLKDNLGDKVSKVKLSNRLSETVCVLSTDQYGYSARMEIIMKAQAFADPDSFKYMTPKAKIMELNPHHPIVKEMLNLVESGEDERATELGHLVYDTALISSGYLMNDNVDYAKRMYKWISSNIGVDSDAEIVEDWGEDEAEPEEETEPKSDSASSDNSDSSQDTTDGNTEESAGDDTHDEL